MAPACSRFHEQRSGCLMFSWWLSEEKCQPDMYFLQYQQYHPLPVS